MAPRSIVLVLLLLAACGGETGTPDQPGAGRGTPDRASDAPPDTARDAGAVAAGSLVAAKSIAEAVDVTRDALRAAGIALADSNGTVSPATGRVSPVRVLPPEVVQLAAEARQRATDSHLSLDQLARMLGDMGWPWGQDADRGEQMRQVVRAWVQNAQQRPDDAESFTPLFLAGMARQQRPAVDLAGDDWSAPDLRLTYLEAQMILGALAGRYPANRGGAPAQTGMRSGGLAVHYAAYAPVQADGVCDGAKEWFGRNIGTQLAGTYGQWGVGQGLERALTHGLGDAVAASVGAAVEAVGAALKVIKLAELYSKGDVALRITSDVPAHRPDQGDEDRVVIVAQAGVNEDDYRDYEAALRKSSLSREVRNCLETAGLPSWGELGDLAAEAETWLVRWKFPRGFPQHLEFMRAENDWTYFGQQAMRLTRTSPTSAEATLRLILVGERVPDHPEPDLHDDAVVRAEVDVSEMPGVNLITNVLVGGVVGLGASLAELGLGWFQAMVPLKSSIVIPILYHDRGVPIYIVEDREADVSVSGVIGFAKGRVRTHEVFTGHLVMRKDSVWQGEMILGATAATGSRISRRSPGAARRWNGRRRAAVSSNRWAC